MRGRESIVIGVATWFVIGFHGGSSATKPTLAVTDQSAEAKQLPAELDTLNVASRKMYAEARTRELSTIPVVIVVSGDDLVLRKDGKRTVAPVIPAEYHTLKSVAHSTLALCTHLTHEPGRRLDE